MNPKESIFVNIVRKIKTNGQKNFENKWFLIGDSYYDFECAIKNDIKFIFASAWSEIVNPLELINKKNVLTISGIEELNLDLLKSKF